MLKLLLSLKCNCCYADENGKKTTLHDTSGQTALYWIVTKVPDLVCIKINKIIYTQRVSVAFNRP